MRAHLFAAGFGLLLGLAPVQAEVSVAFVEPERYTDLGNYGYDHERNLRTLEHHLKTQGGRCLQQGQTLALKVFDVDLAGHYEWWHRSGYQLRVMRDITWPRLDLQYAWRDAEGNVLGQGRERVSDMSYLWRSAYVRSDRDELPYEKMMLRDWFERRLCRDRS